MLFDNLINITGNSKIILRAYSNMSINGITYKKDEPILILDDVEANLTYDSVNKNITNKGAVLANYQIAYPSKLFIQPMKMTSNLYKLMGKKTNKTNCNIPITVEVESDDNGEVILNYPINFNMPYYIYDENKNLVDIIINNDSIITLEPNKVYIISYYTIKDTVESYQLQKEINGLFKIELLTQGEINSKTVNMLININKAALTNLPDFTLDNNNIITMPIEFTILNNSIEVVYYA